MPPYTSKFTLFALFFLRRAISMTTSNQEKVYFLIHKVHQFLSSMPKSTDIFFVDHLPV